MHNSNNSKKYSSQANLVIIRKCGGENGGDGRRDQVDVKVGASDSSSSAEDVADGGACAEEVDDSSEDIEEREEDVEERA